MLLPRIIISDDNLTYNRSRGFGRSFIALHLGFYHYATLLYFQFPDTQLSSSKATRAYAARCKEDASTSRDLLRKSHEREGYDTVYMIVAHMTVVSFSAYHDA